MSEIEALRLFADQRAASLPHLIAWKTAVQGTDGLMPDGYIAYTVMTLLPGNHLMDLKFWSMDDADKEEIRSAFPIVLKSVWRLGIDPYDCALRNVMWEPKTKVLSLVDFEHWRPNTKDPVNMTEREELTKWGLLHTPPHPTHWQAFFAAETQLH
ncbi:hypothetical protein DOTSEDRAFT_81767 [Dothistroma septosporum NZE10]|uniref:Aminoglycoside phosphotransferase domain-containing protein n=1 Tax=Dothistroma septosporum (strain NZE10 / CBS 128990) TaxID=675120 RepID=N1PH44_DOTSN|nr:hypothetical protein DOTSEDRAFT_81767 [Dothistroma septosporum NZE10]